MFTILIQRFACVNEILELVFAGNFRTARLDYCPFQTFRITGLNISLLQICRRLTPAQPSPGPLRAPVTVASAPPKPKVG